MPDYAFFDTTAFTGARDLESTSWRKITAAIKEGVLQAATSQVTVLESGRQASETIEAKARQVSEARAVLATFGIDFLPPEIPTPHQVQRLLPDWLDTNGVTVLPMPDASHVEVVARDIDVRAPFARSGKGYRDTLIWLTLLAWVRDLPELVASVFFVTADSQDFCAPNGGLRRDLLAELPPGVQVEILQRPQDLAARVELETAPSVATIVTEHALKFIETALLHETLDGDLTSWDTVVDEVTVSEVSADDGDAQLVDTFVGDTQLWTVDIPAELGVNGYVYKADLPGLDDTLTVSDPDWNSHYAEVAGRISCTVKVLVRLEADLETSESEIQELVV